MTQMICHIDSWYLEEFFLFTDLYMKFHFQNFKII